MRRILTLTTAALIGTAAAHAELETSTPTENSTVAAPREVKLTFGEGVELKFSNFKVYPLATSGDKLKVNAAAGALKTKVMALKTDAAARADLGARGQGATPRVVTLPLKPNLKAGPYVVMWKALSEDSHPVEGYFVFNVKSGAGN